MRPGDLLMTEGGATLWMPCGTRDGSGFDQQRAGQLKPGQLCVVVATVVPTLWRSGCVLVVCGGGLGYAVPEEVRGVDDDPEPG